MEDGEKRQSKADAFSQTIFKKFAAILKDEKRLSKDFPFVAFIIRPAKAAITILVYLIILLNLTVAVAFALKRLGINSSIPASIISICIFVSCLFYSLAKRFKKKERKRRGYGKNGKKRK